MKKLVIIQTTAPDYRAGFYKEIKEKLKDGFELYGGNYYFEKSVKSAVQIEKTKIKNHFLLKRKVLFQTGIWHLLFKNIVLVLEMNPRILSNWIFLIVRKTLRKETVLWGHAWPRKGKESKSDFVRNLMRILANKIIVYTNLQKEELNIKMPNKVIISAPNSLINASKMVTSNLGKEQNLIYVGRLTKQKKSLFLVKSFYKGLDILPENTKLIIVGEGEEKENIESFVKEKKIEERVLIKGHISSYHTLKELYATSFFSVSPGYVGLSITQSFGFGVPMLVSRDENHSPEIEATRPDKNTVFFDTDNTYDFIDKIEDVYRNKEDWINKRKNIVEFCKEKYSIDAMAKVFIDLVK